MSKQDLINSALKDKVILPVSYTPPVDLSLGKTNRLSLVASHTTNDGLTTEILGYNRTSAIAYLHADGQNEDYWKDKLALVGFGYGVDEANLPRVEPGDYHFYLAPLRYLGIRHRFPEAALLLHNASLGRWYGLPNKVLTWEYLVENRGGYGLKDLIKDSVKTILPGKYTQAWDQTEFPPDPVVRYLLHFEILASKLERSQFYFGESKSMTEYPRLLRKYLADKRKTSQSWRERAMRDPSERVRWFASLGE